MKARAGVSVPPGVIICGKTKITYVVKDDEGNYSHGDTPDEARADLMVKRTSKDLTQFKAWKLDKVVSKADAILAYRSITGACSAGVRHWLVLRQHGRVSHSKKFGFPWSRGELAGFPGTDATCLESEFVKGIPAKYSRPL